MHAADLEIYFYFELAIELYIDDMLSVYRAMCYNNDIIRHLPHHEISQDFQCQSKADLGLVLS